MQQSKKNVKNCVFWILKKKLKTLKKRKSTERETMHTISFCPVSVSIKLLRPL